MNGNHLAPFANFLRAFQRLVRWPVAGLGTGAFTGAFKVRLTLLGGAVAGMNVAAWLWAYAAFHGKPVAMALALMIYGLGLRHAVDADHIAAIDNVTRKLMQTHDRPVSVGLFFALGHSAIVVVVAVTVARTASMLGRFQAFRDVGGTLGTIVSSMFLIAIGLMNLAIFFPLCRTYLHVRAGGLYAEEDLNFLLHRRGLLSRLFRPMFALVSKSWHMLLLGTLFGLGFDTATEITMFSVSVAQSANGIALSTVVIFPGLFAAGMSLVDSADGALMAGAYQWAYVQPLRKLYYNMTVTLVSVAIALLIGSIEALGLIGSRFGLADPFWKAIAALNANFNHLGFLVIGVILATWALSYVIYRRRDAGRIRTPSPWSNSIGSDA